jgi:hypothetical protein
MKYNLSYFIRAWDEVDICSYIFAAKFVNNIKAAGMVPSTSAFVERLHDLISFPSL